MPQFLLLLHEDAGGWQKLSPEEMQTAIEKYRAWRDKPFTRSSQRLAADPGRVIRTQGGQPRVVDGPYSATKEILGGFYLIEAADYDEAVQLALAHPHVEYGQTVEVRKLWEPPAS